MTMRLKRLFDIVASAAALAVLWPLLLLVSLMIIAKLGRPVFFTQLRPGLDGRPFRLIKFRTMRNAADARGQPLPDAERLTDFGKALRATSLDELPELWNVLRGDMSLVGPRPLLLQYLTRYTPEQARRHEVRPGLTGWAQVNGRNAISWEEKFSYDVWYVDHRNMLLDLWVIVLTVGSILTQRGITADAHASMPEFLGTLRGGQEGSTGPAQ